MNNPLIIKNSLLIQPSEMSPYSGGWTPRFRFLLQGPTPAGGEVIATVNRPDSSDWLTLTIAMNETEDGALTNCDMYSYEGDHHTTDTGDFSFTIRLVSELDGIDETLVSGVLNVEQIDEKSYHTNHDWLLPLGQLFIDTSYDADAPPLNASFWYKGGVDMYQLGAYLFYNGKRIYGTEDSSHATMESKRELTVANSKNYENDYKEISVNFRVVKGYRNCDYSNMDDWHLLIENPGEYEIKFTIERKPIRSIKFSVGDDGRIEQSGAIMLNQNYVGVMNVDVTVTAKDETDFDRDTLSSKAYYGNAGLESDLTIDSMYAFCQQTIGEEESPSDNLSEETRALLESAIGKSENVYRWYYDEMINGQTASGDVPDSSQCDLAKMYVSEVLPKLEQLEAELGSDYEVDFNSEKQWLSTIKSYMQEIGDGADKILQGEQQAQEDALAPYRELLRNDKLRIFEDHPATEYRYYTSKKQIIESPEELAESMSWYFEGTENQGYVNERWTVRGWKFDDDQNITDTVEDNGFGVNAPSSVFV